ncbi:MAG: CoA transferase [Candidatus Rokubacteria bacterium]|nr:CoA transferase [Candidatus Rokubacteria bacterium]
MAATATRPEPAGGAPALLPLSGYRVLELAHLIAGPVCGMYLADMGAEVIKVEAPEGGDAARSIYATALGGEGSLFVTVNRNKRSVALDLGHADGREIFLRLAATADVVIEAYRGGVAERLGIDHARLATVNPRLVYCSISAFGPTGPWRERPGLDPLVQALSGLMGVTGEPDRGPVLCGAPVVDTIGALLATQGVLTALLHRERTGQGQRVDASLLDGALLAQAARLCMFFASGREVERSGSAHPELVPFQAFAARDGWIYVAVWVERLWVPFCAAIGRPALAGDPRFATRADRYANRPELIRILGDLFVTRTVADWLETLQARDVLCAPVNRYGDLLGDPRVQASGMIVEQEHPRAGRIRTLNTPVRLEKTPGGIRTPAPALGEDTGAVLESLGVTAAEVARLRGAGVVR